MEYLTVSAINEYLKYKINQDPYLQTVYLKGEVTNFRERNNHQYFSLKDEEAVINIIMFKHRYAKVDFKVENGVQVTIVGKIDLYIKNGSYSLIADAMQLSGEGALHKRFEEIKAKLLAEGIFNKPKKPKPRYPKKVAVVTSETGAVIHDIIRTINQRFPLTSITLFPTLVQGPGAAEDIAEQIKAVEARKAEFDAVIVGRGGGSYEDLFCFNEEVVVRAAYDLSIPLITSVGHETDYTLIDDVADYSAATPTMAAEQLVPDRLNEQKVISQIETRLNNTIVNKITSLNNQLTNIKNLTIFREPTTIYQLKEMQLQNLSAKLQNYQPIKLIEEKKLQVQIYREKLQSFSQKLAKLEQDYQLEKQKLELLNPDSILQRGYAYVSKENKTIESSLQVTKGDNLELHFADGVVKVKVEEKGKKDE